MIGYAMITLRNGHMKLPYIYFNELDMKEVVQALLKFILSHDVNMFTVFNGPMAQYLKKMKWPFVLVRTILRGYLISRLYKDSIDSLSALEIMDGDGDTAFT